VACDEVERKSAIEVLTTRAQGRTQREGGLTKSVGTATDILEAEVAKVRGMVMAVREGRVRATGREVFLRRF
jgi:hypothetical protein